jgi:hypothetical protein
MAQSTVQEFNFDQATRTEATIGFNLEVDTASKLDFPHFSTLAQNPKLEVPYRGGYCMRIDLTAIGASSAYMNEQAAFDIDLANTKYFRFMMFISDDLTMANSDEFDVFRINSAGGQKEVVGAINYTTANGVRFGIGREAGVQFTPLTLGVWHTVELQPSPAGAGAGVLAAWLDGNALTSVTGSTNAGNLINGFIGYIGGDAGTTAGTILFDEIEVAASRIYPLKERWQNPLLMTDSGHAFVGPGTITNVSLLAGSSETGVGLKIFDTDTADINDHTNIVAHLDNSVENEVVDTASMPVKVKRGAYVSLSTTGTTRKPRALIGFENTPAWGSASAVRRYGLTR